MRQLLLLFGILSIALGNAQGYQFLGSYTSNGTPLYLTTSDEVSVETLETIDSSLPESYPVPDYNPHYISSGYDTDIRLNDTADVWVTFISEGAGYRNVLGFYTYDINNPSPTAPEAEDITIIFPNVSALGSGGGLETGNKVHIGNFAAGTGIGWVLLANGWNGNQVTSGYWQLYSNPSYNPESNPSLQYHNVLLQDPENERVILGFEDIRRDYGSCDNDFNDAVFYITASPYTSLTTTNMPDVDSSTDIYSANNGGLESNGDLATLIAKRNFKRAKNNSALNKKALQIPFNKSTTTDALGVYFPEAGMFGTETTYESSPDDLLEITNAVEVFAVDYYEGDRRVSAGLATRTEDQVYNHSKMICDRLNGSILKDVRNVMIKEYQMIHSIIERSNGYLEYALSFSVKLGEESNELYSYWNIEEYPEGEYVNFQLWGGSMGQVATLASEIIETFKSEKELVSEIVENRIPLVFVNKGTYRNGKLELSITNKVNASWGTVNASIARTEVATREEINQGISLNGDWNQNITIDTGYAFDIGLSLTAENSVRTDGLYLADGPWGVDYLEEEATVNEFNIIAQETILEEYNYEIERGIEVSGEVRGTFNIFRNILAGDLTQDMSMYETLEFNIKNTQPIEVIIVTEGLEDWNNRLRYTIPSNENNEDYRINFANFLNGNNAPEEITNVRSVVFSLQGDYNTTTSFDIEINELAFTTEEILSIEENVLEQEYVFNYPNPFKNKTIIKMPEATRYADLMVVDMLGRIIFNEKVKTIDDGRSIQFETNIRSGVYKYIVVDDKGNKHDSSFLIN